MLKPVVVLFALLFSSVCYAEYDYRWFEYHHGWLDEYEALSFNVSDERTGWQVNIIKTGTQEEFLSGFLNSTSERDTNRAADPFYALGVSKLYVGATRFGYVNIGLGLGVGSGDIASNCESKFLGKTCDFEKKTLLGVPLHASIMFGKYFGIGLTVDAFLTTEERFGAIAVSIPIGKFP